MQPRIGASFALFLPLFYFSIVSRQLLGPLLPVIEQDLGISHATAGALFLFGTLGFTVSMLASFLLTRRVTHRSAIILASVLTVAGSLVIFATSSLALLRLGAIVQGIGGGLYFPSAYAAISSLAGPARQGRALALHETGPALAFFSAPLIAQLFSQVTWRWSMAAAAAATGALTIAVALVGTAGRFRGRAPSLRGVSLLLWRPAYLVILLYMGAMAAAGLGAYAIMPVYLVSEHGRDIDQVNTLIALSRVSGIGLVLVSGVLVDRLGARLVLVSSAVSVALMTILIGITDGVALSVAVLLQPLLQQGFWPASLVALGSLAPPRLRPLLISLTVPLVALTGAGIAPAWWGRLGDAGRFSLGFVVTGSLLLALGVVAFILGTGRKRHAPRVPLAPPAAPAPA